MSDTAVIVIPIYKERLSRNEKGSLEQCIKVFNKRKILFCAPEGLSLEEYNIENTSLKEVVFFDPQFFKNVAGYNRLLLSKHFYQNFAAFEFVLIYQLDAWVFSDQLDHWCNRGCSYIGAPWFENFEQSNNSKSLWATGNGGFSLRKIADFMHVFESQEKIFPFQFLWSKYEKYKTWNKLLRLPKILGLYLFKNNTSHLYQLFGENEDHFWSFHAKELDNSFTVAKVEEAVSFAFECNPRRMFELNQQKLPFGIHAWEKYDLPFVETVLFSKALSDN